MQKYKFVQGRIRRLPPSSERKTVRNEEKNKGRENGGEGGEEGKRGGDYCFGRLSV